MTVLAFPLVATEAKPLPIEFDPSITDWIGAIGGVLLGLGTILVAVLAYRAQRQADAARRDSEVAQVTALEAQTQAANAQVDAMRFLADALNHNDLAAAEESEADIDGEAAEPEPAPAEPEPAEPAEPGPAEPAPAEPGTPANGPETPPAAERPTTPEPVTPGRPGRGERPQRDFDRRQRRSKVRWGARLEGDKGFALTNVGTETARDITVMVQNFGGGHRRPDETEIAEIAPGETSVIDAGFTSGAVARMLIVRWHEGDRFPHVERVVAA